MQQIRDFETLLWHDIVSIGFDAQSCAFGRIIFTLADGHVWEFQLSGNSLKRGIDGIVIDGIQPEKTREGGKAALCSLLYRLSEDDPPECTLKAFGLLKRDAATASSTRALINAARADESRLTCGRLVRLRDGEALRYDGKTYQFCGAQQWVDVNTLIAAGGEYVQLRKGFPQRFIRGDALAFKQKAIQAERPGRKGTRRYRLLV